MHLTGEEGYLTMLQEVMRYGEQVEDRTGVGSIQRVVPYQIDWDMWWGFSCLTTKKVFWKGAIAELIWMCRGSTNVRELSQILYGDPDKPNFWTPNYDAQAVALGYTDGELGPVYGKQLVDFNGVNQLKYVEELLKADPYSRRAVISMWNPAELDQMALPPCHYTSVFNVKDIGVEKLLNLTVVMRSNDLFLGAPFNYVFYGALLLCFSEILGLTPGIYSHISVNSHVYSNQVEQVKTQLTRTPAENRPELVLSKKAKELFKMFGVDAFHMIGLEDFEMIDYFPQGSLTAKMAV